MKKKKWKKMQQKTMHLLKAPINAIPTQYYRMASASKMHYSNCILKYSAERIKGFTDHNNNC